MWLKGVLFLVDMVKFVDDKEKKNLIVMKELGKVIYILSSKEIYILLEVKSIF